MQMSQLAEVKQFGLDLLFEDSPGNLFDVALSYMMEERGVIIVVVNM